MNSGFGYIDKLIFDDIDIVIYRKEDIYKVLVHEIIHLYGLYLNGDEERIEECTKGIKELFVSVQNVDIKFNEAFTEAKAIYH